MNTEIKNTLFSFVTMRAPELADEKHKETRFVFRDENTIGHFDNAVSNRPGGTSKWDAIQAACDSSFDTLLLNNESEVRSLNQDLYDFSIWVVRNRTDWENDELDQWLSKVQKINTTDNAYKQLWDNLFYQVITQDNFYVKEGIIHMLVANNFLINLERVDDVINDLMQATVVLPKYLFVEDGIINTGSIASKTSEPSVTSSYPNLEMRNIQTIALSNINIERYSILLKELKAAEIKYRREYDAEYKIQKAAYDLKYVIEWDNYYKQVEDAKKTWCSIRDPKLPHNLSDPCDKPALVPFPNIPDFIFVFREELDITFLQNVLSVASFEALMELVEMNDQYLSSKSSNTNFTGSIQSSSTFDELYVVTKNATSTAKNAVYNTSTVNAPTYMSYGGVVVPMTARAVNPFVFSLCYKNVPNSKINFDLLFDVPDSSWQVTNFNCTAIFTDGTSNTEGSPNPLPFSAVDQKISITNIFSTTGMSLEDFRKLHILRGVITFANGCQKTFSIEGTFVSTCFTGTLVGDCSKGSVNPTLPNPTDDSALYVPKGFGYKQLGIADYKIVEQTVHCYVEGEVAHIENVMARERREKSTRRLLKTETTVSDTTEKEKQNTTDTSTTERYEMQNEVAQVLQQSKDFNASTEFKVGGDKWSLSATAGMATHNSKELNTKQAITNAKEVVQKATDRITTKVTQTRIQKITEEFEENNIHEFDNRQGSKHVVGVYRWVDKIYKNQVVNFGKRLMFEFMIPEPAKLHRLGMEIDPTQPTPLVNSQIVEPVDPRKFDYTNTTPTSLNLSDFSKVNELTMKYWSGYYNVDVDPMPLEEIYAGKSIAIENTDNDPQSISKNDAVKIDDRYIAVAGKAIISGSQDGDGSQRHIISILYGNNHLTINNINYNTTNYLIPPNTISDKKGLNGSYDTGAYLPISGFKNEVPISAQYYNYDIGSVNFSIKCKLTEEARQQWQKTCFKAIIDKYEEEKTAYDDKMSAHKDEAIANKDTNPAFFRQMMNLVLRKNCISYLIDQTPDVKRTYGKKMYSGSSFTNYEIKVDEKLDDYGAFVMFMEQAFEWSIMSYSFYPYYWADRTAWKNMYQFDASDDPLFRSFMQSGMARVVVTVRPGFEEAVRFYLQTGKIWNGGSVPVIEDKLFISIVEELREPAGKKEGKAWATRVPTSLTILQANSIGLEVEKALPCNCEEVNAKTFENYKDVPCGDNFLLNNAQINGGTGTAKVFGKISGNDDLISRIILKTLAGLVQDVALTNEAGLWELNNVPAGNYDLLLDATNVFPASDYDVIEGSKIQTIALVEEQSLEVNLTVQKK